MSENTKRQGMAITSLVFGIVSVMCLGLFAGIPAIILGHMAHRRTRRAPEEYTGAGLAMAGFIMGYLSFFTTIVLVAILAGISLPALAKAKGRAQSIKCTNNMKQIGLAFRIWSTDHQGRFPFNSSTNQNGTAQPGEVVAKDSMEVFQALANELSTPLILVCPADPSARPATSFPNLKTGNVSYVLETGPEVKETNPQEVLVRCPIHGHELLCDGSVQQGRGP